MEQGRKKSTDELRSEALLFGRQVGQDKRSLYDRCTVAGTSNTVSGKSRARNVSDEELWEAGKMRVRIGGEAGEADETDLCGRLGRGMGAVSSHTEVLSLLVVKGRRKPAKARASWLFFPQLTEFSFSE